jgi:hypothetical protein
MAVPLARLKKESINQLIFKCNGSIVRESIAKVLMLKTDQITSLLNEIQVQPDGRFGDNLLNALLIIHHMYRDRDVAQIFRDNLN